MIVRIWRAMRANAIDFMLALQPSFKVMPDSQPEKGKVQTLCKNIQYACSAVQAGQIQRPLLVNTCLKRC
jgi:hypothetical protein